MVCSLKREKKRGRKVYLDSKNGEGIIGVHNRMNTVVGHRKPNTHGGAKGEGLEKRRFVFERGGRENERKRQRVHAEEQHGDMVVPVKENDLFFSNNQKN